MGELRLAAARLQNWLPKMRLFRVKCHVLHAKLAYFAVFGGAIVRAAVGVTTWCKLTRVMAISDRFEGPGWEYDPSLFPRSYSASLGWRILFVTVSVVLVAFAIWEVRDSSGGSDAHNPISLFLTMFFVFLIFLAIYMCVFGLKMKVTLTDKRIELRNLFTRESMLRADVAGWKIGDTPYIRFWIFQHRDGGKKLQVPMILKTDSAFDAWLYSLPHG